MQRLKVGSVRCMQKAVDRLGPRKMNTLVVFSLLLYGLHAADPEAGDINIIVANKKNDVSSDLYRLNMALQTTEEIPTFKLIRPTAITIDDVTGRIYWSDVMAKEIRTARLDGSDEKTFLDLNTESIVDGIAVDAQHRYLFYTDRGNSVLVSVSMDDPSDLSVLLENIDNMPRAVAAYPEKKLLFWSEWGTSAKIRRCSYSNCDSEVLVDTDIRWPNGLALDTADETLYWCDGYTGRIESVNVDGDQRKVLLKTRLNFYGIAFFEDILYTTDWSTNAVQAFALNGTKVASISAKGFKRLSGLAVLRVPQTVCDDGTYGFKCSFKCGHCLNDDVCNGTDGRCPRGCEAGWTTDTCDETSCNTGSSVHGHGFSSLWGRTGLLLLVAATISGAHSLC